MVGAQGHECYPRYRAGGCLRPCRDGNDLPAIFKLLHWICVETISGKLSLLSVGCEPHGWHSNFQKPTQVAHETQNSLFGTCNVRFQWKKIAVYEQLFGRGHDPTCKENGCGCHSSVRLKACVVQICCGSHLTMVPHDSLKKMMTHLGILRSKSRVSNHVQMSNMSIHMFICTNKCVYIISIYI